MAGYADYLIQKLLKHVFLIGAYTQPSHIMVALSTADPLHDGSGMAEPSGNNYSRVQFDTWQISGNVITNNGAITFPQLTGSIGSISHVALFDTVPNYLASAMLASNVVNFSGDSAANKLICPGHSFSVNDEVRCTGSGLPSGINPNTQYFVTVVSGDEIQISTTMSGGTLSLVADGYGAIGKSLTKSFGNLDTPQIPTGLLSLTIQN